VRRGVGGLVQVDDAVAHVRHKVPLQGLRPARYGRVMVCAHVQLLEVAQKKRPLRRVKLCFRTRRSNRMRHFNQTSLHCL
jgi:hypothetical protein